MAIKTYFSGTLGRRVTIPERDEISEEDRKAADWYINKYNMKMKGSTVQKAKGWVEGTNQPYHVQDIIWEAIENNL